MMPMPPRKSDNDAERVARLKARLDQLRVAGGRAAASRLERTQRQADASLRPQAPPADVKKSESR
jgi:hypothetical protein